MIRADPNHHGKEAGDGNERLADGIGGEAELLRRHGPAGGGGSAAKQACWTRVSEAPLAALFANGVRG